METQEKRTSPITGREGAPIDINLAAEWTRNHRHRNPKDTISQFFGREILNQILNQQDCMGIRIYYANDQKLNGWQKFWVAVSNFLLHVLANVRGQQHFIITGVTADGEDQLPGNNKVAEATPLAGTQTFQLMKAEKQNIVGEQAVPCPGTAGCPQNVLTKD
ncbi:hypothetical protein LX99_04866 [Mucilaginibacter oryzae]|uniref:Uncharacterized protein n=1 Tax=Mucilaginibacter oryzae TaxID=468058 RepID=A0A316GV52_9SPHI|nr:hypothetical protein [Mucilaginibacter oryzae]PWK67646.1 hypothetical protein LX99_04866 [Mucilaginibacter oryzae]